MNLYAGIARLMRASGLVLFALIWHLAVPSISAQSTALSFGQSTQVSVDSAGNGNQFTFTGSVGQLVNVQVTNSSFDGCLSLTLSVFNPDGSQLASTAMCGTGNVGLPSLNLPQSGTYLVVLSPGIFSGGTATLTLSVNQSGQVLSDSVPATVEIDLPGQGANLTFNGTAGQQVNILVSNSTFSGCLSLSLVVWNPDGSGLGSTATCGSGNLNLSSLNLQQTGTYTVSLLPGNGGTGTASVLYSVNPASVPIQLGTSATVGVTVPGTVTRLAFGGTSGQLINVQATNSTFDGCLSLTMAVLNPDGSQLASNSMCGQGSLGLPSLTLAQTGNYTIVLTAGNGGTGTATVTLSTDQIQQITSNSPLQATINLPGQNSRFLFNASRGQQGSVQVSSATFSGCLSLTLSVLNPDGSQLGSTATCGAASLSLPSLQFNQTGTYTILLSPGGGGTGGALVSLSILAPADPPAFSVAPGTYSTTQTVTLTDTAPGASISYTIDGSTPSTGSTLYGSPIVVSSTETIQAIASAPGFTNSAVAVASYMIPAAPIVSGLSSKNSQVGSTITISGKNFAASQGSSTVTLNGNSLSVGSWSDNSIIFTVPAGAHSGPLVVSNALGSSLPVTLNVLDLSSGFTRAVTVSHANVPNTDQANFPLLLSSVYPFLANTANGGRLQNSAGYDVAFTSDAAGLNMLDYEIDNYDAATGTAAYWIRIPSLSHTSDTTFYVWYGVQGVTSSFENKPGVWSNGYSAVYHMGSGQALDTSDSTGVNGIAVNVAVSPASGMIGGGGGFSNGGSYLQLTDNLSLRPGTALTLEAWANPAGLGDWNKIIALDYYGDGSWSSPYLAYALQSFSGTNEMGLQVTEAGNGPAVPTSGSVALNTWNQVVGTYDGTQMVAFLNGVAGQPYALAGPIDYGTSRDVTIGARSPYSINTSEGWNGFLDEVRISSVARSADWIATEYSNQSNPAAFASLGDESTASGAAVPVVTSITPNPVPVGGLITVVGSGFGQTQGTVTLNGASLTSTSWSDSSITLAVPTDAVSGPIIVTSGGIASLQVNLVISPAPSLSGLSPALGVPGVSVVISGSHFGATQANSTVTLNAQAIAVSSWSDTTIIAIIPSNASTGDVSVSLGGVSSNSLTFKVVSLAGAQMTSVIFNHSLVPNSDQTNFPVLISGTYPFLANVANGGNVQNVNGSDIIFTSDIAGQNLLDFEIDSYNPVNGTSAFWVRIPTLSHTTDTTVYMWYGISGLAQSQENRLGVWSNGYAGVWHFGTASSAITTDSTSNANNGVNNGVQPAVGLIGNSGTFDGTGNTFFRIPANNSYKPTSTLTLEAWVNMAAGTFYPDIFSLDFRADGSWSYPYQAYALDFLASSLQPRLEIAPAGSQASTWGQSPISNGQWAHVVGSYDGSNMNVFVNGALAMSTPQSGSLTYGTSQDLNIGSRSPYTTGEAINGLIDEARVSIVARSADWIATEYANQSNPMGFYSLGNGTSGGVTVTPMINSITPNPASVGGMIVIAGTGFGQRQGSSLVTLNGKSLSATSWSDSNITLTLPPGVASGPVIVGTSVVVSAPLTLNLQTTPFIARLSPSAGVPGVRLVISGIGFGNIQGSSGVALNGQALYTSSWSDSTIVASIPSNATTGNVVVTVGDSGASASFTVIDLSTSFVRAVTVDHSHVSNMDQSNFPILISAAFPFLANVSYGGKVRSIDGHDIFFTADPGAQNVLDHEIDSYNPVTGQAAFWVRIPTLSHTSDTVIYMWYGIPGLSQSVENKQGVWSDGYVAVYHMGAEGSLSTVDSTGDTGTASNYGVTAASGMFGGAGRFANDLSPSYLSVAANRSFKPTQNLTVQAWINPSVLGSWNKIVSLDYRADGSWNPPYVAYALEADANTNEMAFQATSAGEGVVSSSLSLAPVNTWSEVVGTFDGNSLISYLNGMSREASSLTGPIDYGTSSDLAIGARSPYSAYSSEGWAGLIDEVRISSVARSSDWIATEYANQANPSSFYELGPELSGLNDERPTINSFSPNPALAGSPLTLSGTGFGSTQLSSTITLDGEALQVLSWSDSSVTIGLPANIMTATLVMSVRGLSSVTISVPLASSGSGSNPGGGTGPANCSDAASGVFVLGCTYVDELSQNVVFPVDPNRVLPTSPSNAVLYGPIDTGMVLKNFKQVAARGLIVDGVSAAILVYPTIYRDRVTFKVDPDSGATLSAWNPNFMSGPSAAAATTSLDVEPTDLLGGPKQYYAVIILQSPPSNADLSLGQMATVEATQTGYVRDQTGADPNDPGYTFSDTARSVELHSRPIIFLHGLWGSSDSLAGIANYLQQATQGKLASSYLWSDPWDFQTPCYSKQLSFDWPTSDPFSVNVTADSPTPDPCEHTAAEAIRTTLATIETELTSPGQPLSPESGYVSPSSIVFPPDPNGTIVGGQVDMVVHSMGGLAARYFMTLPEYKNPTNHGQGAFNTVITLDTPEQGSNLANYLTDHYDLPFNGSSDPGAVLIWVAGCSHLTADAEITYDPDLGTCFAHLMMPIGPSSTAQNLPTSCGPNPISCGAVASIRSDSSHLSALPSATDENGVTVPLLPHPRGGWLGVSSFFPDGQSQDSVLRYTIQHLVNSVNGGAGPSVSTLIGDPNNDAVVSVSSQQAGLLDPGSAYSPLAHSPIPNPTGLVLRAAYQLGGVTTTNPNVENSTVVDDAIICYLQHSGDYVAGRHCAAGVSTSANRNSPQSAPEKSATAIAEASSQYGQQSKPSGRVTHDRLKFGMMPKVLVLGERNEIPIRSIGTGLLTIIGNQSVGGGPGHAGLHSFAGGESNTLTIHQRDGVEYVDVTPLVLGKVDLSLVSTYADGVMGYDRVTADVIPPFRQPSRVIVGTNSLPDANVAIKRFQFPFDIRRDGKQYLYVQAQYDNVEERIAVPARFAHFMLRAGNADPVVRLDSNTGEVIPLRIGHDIIETTYGGLKVLTCVVIDAAGPTSRYRGGCKEILHDGEKLSR